MPITQLLFGDIIDLSIIDITKRADHPTWTDDRCRKNKIALCAHPLEKIFFIINSKPYAFAAHETISISPGQLSRLKKTSYLYLFEHYIATNEDIIKSSIQNVFRFNDPELYTTINYMITNSSSLPRVIINKVCAAYQQFISSQ